MKERVKKGEKYWYITTILDVVDDYDERHRADDIRFGIDNYFIDEEEALFTARKLRAVLKGAEVYTLEELTEIKANAFADGMEAEQRKSKIVK